MHEYQLNEKRGKSFKLLSLNLQTNESIDRSMPGDLLSFNRLIDVSHAFINRFQSYLSTNRWTRKQAESHANCLSSIEMNDQTLPSFSSFPLDKRSHTLVHSLNIRKEKIFSFTFVVSRLVLSRPQVSSFNSPLIAECVCWHRVDSCSLSMK